MTSPRWTLDPGTAWASSSAYNIVHVVRDVYIAKYGFAKIAWTATESDGEYFLSKIFLVINN